MIVASIQITGTDVYVPYKTTITSGMVGVQVQLDYMDPLWDGLHKTVVFYGATVKAIITDDTIVTVPAEVLAKPNYTFSVGVFGWDDTGLVIPTLVADIDSVRPGTNPSGDTSTNKALPVWAQLRAMIGNLDDLDTTAKNNLVEAVNEALTKGGGSVDESEIQRIVEEYLTANPPTVTVDTALSDTSENPVQNKVITDAIKKLSSGNVPEIEEVPVTVSVGTEAVTLDETAPEQAVNLAWNVPGSKVVPAFENYYIEKSGITYPRTFDTSGYTQFWSNNGYHGNSDAFVSGHKYFQAFHYAMDGDSTAKISGSGSASYITPTNSETISGSGWAYVLAKPNSAFGVNFCLINTSTGTGTIDYLYCIDITALQEAGTITATTISELAELFGELPLIPGQNFDGETTSGEATLSITRDGEVTDIPLGTETASVKGGDILVMDTGNVTFTLTVFKIVTDDEQTVYSIYPDWSEWTWVVVGDSLTDETINATKKYYRYIAEKTGIKVIVVGQGGTGYARDNSKSHADATNMYYQRCANLADLVINSGGDTSKVIVSVFGSINDWCVTNPYDGRFIGGDTYTTVDAAIGTGTDAWNDDGDNTLTAHMRHCYEVIYAQLPLCKLFVVNHLFYAGIPNQESRIVKPLTDVCETMRIKHFDLYHNCSYPIDTNQEFASKYTTDAPADIASATNSYGHPSNKYHEDMLAPYFYRCLQEVIPLA